MTKKANDAPAKGALVSRTHRTWEQRYGRTLVMRAEWTDDAGLSVDLSRERDGARKRPAGKFDQEEAQAAADFLGVVLDMVRLTPGGGS